MKFLTTLSAAALAAISFTAPAKAVDYSDCVNRFGNTNCAALILAGASCAAASDPRTAHWSKDKKLSMLSEYVKQRWDKAGVNFDRIDKNVLEGLTDEYIADWCQKWADKTFPNRNLY